MTELREYHRAPSSKKVELVYGGECHTGSLKNISFNGALLHLSHPAGLTGGAGCLLRIHLDTASEPRPPLQIWSEVVHCDHDLLGVKFIDHDAGGSRCISTLMELMREEPDRDRDGLGRIRGCLANYRDTR